MAKNKPEPVQSASELLNQLETEGDMKVVMEEANNLRVGNTPSSTLSMKQLFMLEAFRACFTRSINNTSPGEMISKLKTFRTVYKEAVASAIMIGEVYEEVTSPQVVNNDE